MARFQGIATSCWDGLRGGDVPCGPVEAEVQFGEDKIETIAFSWESYRFSWDFQLPWTPQACDVLGCYDTAPFGLGDPSAFFATWKSWTNMTGAQLQFAEGLFDFSAGEWLELAGTMAEVFLEAPIVASEPKGLWILVGMLILALAKSMPIVRRRVVEL